MLHFPDFSEASFANSHQQIKVVLGCLLCLIMVVGHDEEGIFFLWDMLFADDIVIFDFPLGFGLLDMMLSA